MHTTWYQPLENEADIRLAVDWVLARPRIFLNSVGDVSLLPAVLRAAAELGGGASEGPPSEADDGELRRARRPRLDLRPVSAGREGTR